MQRFSSPQSTIYIFLLLLLLVACFLPFANKLANLTIFDTENKSEKVLLSLWCVSFFGANLENLNIVLFRRISQIKANKAPKLKVGPGA